MDNSVAMQTSAMPLPQTAVTALTLNDNSIQLEKVVPMGMKKCGHCQATKGVPDFSADSSRGDGLRGWCKLCEAEARSRRYKRRKESELELHPKRRQVDATLTAQHPRHTIYGSFAPSQQHVGLSTPQHFHPSEISPAASLSGGLTAALPTAASLSTAAAVRQELLDAWTAQAAQVAQRQPPELAAQMMGTWTQQAAMTQTPQLAAQLVQAWAQQAQQQVAEQHLSQLSVQLALLQAATAIKSPINPLQESVMQAAPIAGMRPDRRSAFAPVRHSLGQGLPIVHSLVPHLAMQQEPARQPDILMSAFAGVAKSLRQSSETCSLNTSDSELSAVESLADMKRSTQDRSLMTPDKGLNWGNGKNDAVQSGRHPKPAVASRPCRLTTALSDAMQQRLTELAGGLGGGGVRANLGNSHAVAGLAAGVLESASLGLSTTWQQRSLEQEAMMKRLLVELGQPLQQLATPSPLSNYTKPSTNENPPHPAIGSLLDSLPSNTLLRAAFSTRQGSRGNMDGTSLGSQLASHSTSDVQHSPQPQLQHQHQQQQQQQQQQLYQQHTLSETPALYPRMHISVRQDGYRNAVDPALALRPSAGLRNTSCHVYRPVPSIGSPLSGAIHASPFKPMLHAPMLMEGGDADGMAVQCPPILVTAAQSAEQTAWLAKTCLLMLSLRAVGFAR